MGKKTEKARITIACSTCRSRKQKCSGEKPVCKPCFNNNRPCDWPEQLRRGPPKGYVEALEHRLRVTEGALLKLLSQVSDTQLHHAIPDAQSPQADRGASYTPLARLEKKGVQDWLRFPLDTAQSIREWQSACTDHEFGPRHRLDFETCRIEQEQPGYEKRRPGTKSRSSTATGLHIGRTASQNDFGRASQMPFEAEHQLPQTASNEQEATAQVPPPLANLKPSEHTWEELQPVQTQSFWSGAPSFSFQDRFLW